MSHDDGAVQHQLPKEPPETPPFFTFMIDSHAVFHDVMFAGGSMAGLMVLDTACQRTVCGREWMAQHAQALQDSRLQPHSVSCAEAFQFGRGQPITQRGAEFIFLLSLVMFACYWVQVWLTHQFHSWLQILCWKHWIQSLTLASNKCFSERLESRQTSFDQYSHLLQVWKTLSQERLWKNPHPEIIIPGVTDLEPMKAQSPVPGVFCS